MRKYRGNETVEPGIYFNPKELAFRSVEQAERLPGAADEAWWAVPTLVMMIAAPVLGLVYVMFLPFVGFAMLGGVVLRKARDLARTPIEGVLRVLRPAWQPARAFLGRRGKTARRAPREGEEGPADDWAEETRRELDPDR